MDAPTSEIYCRRCWYVLNHLPEQRCPECGLAFDPARPRTFRTVRRGHYRLRQAARIAALLALAAGVWVAFQAVTLRNQWRETEAITRLGGWHVAEPVGPEWFGRVVGSSLSRRVVEVNMVYHEPSRSERLDNANVTDAALRHARRLPHLRKLLLKETQASDKELANVAGLTGLTHLYMWDAPVGDEGLAHLRGLRNLTRLHISHSKITGHGMRHLRGLHQLREFSAQYNPGIDDEGLSHLSGLKDLDQVWVCGSAVTDDGLAHLKSLPKLRVLAVQESRITDKGFEHLKQCAALRIVYMEGSKVTDQGVADFQASRPGVRVDR